MCQAQQVLDDRAQQRLELLEKQMMLDLDKKKHPLNLTAGTHRKSFSKRINKKRNVSSNPHFSSAMLVSWTSGIGTWKPKHCFDAVT